MKPHCLGLPVANGRAQADRRGRDEDVGARRQRPSRPGGRGAGGGHGHVQAVPDGPLLRVPWSSEQEPRGHVRHEHQVGRPAGGGGWPKEEPARAGGRRLLPQDLRDRTRGAACVACVRRTLAMS
eukprot:scaffold45105_cov67-Phaeocystis_antarctica.AAC.10